MHNQLPVELQRHFFKIILEQGNIDEFENWLYQQQNLENYLKNDDYLALISLDFKNKQSLINIEKIIMPYLNYTDYYNNSLKNSLLILMNSPNDIEHLAKIYDFYCQGYYFLRKLALSYGLYAEHYLTGNLKKDWALSGQHLQEIIQQAKWLYDDLDNGKIVLLKSPSYHYDDEHYQDFRHYHDRKKTDLD